MNLLLCQAFFFICVFIKYGDNHSAGASTDACTSMTPGHGVASQACTTKYRILSDKTQYYTNQTVRITINGTTASDTFKGFLLIAKTQTSGTIIGTWLFEGSDIQTIACDGKANTGVTHSSPAIKTTISVIWTPPSTIATENTVIKATMVDVKTSIYVDCFSVTLTPRQSNQSTNTPGVTTAIPTTAPQTDDTGLSARWTYANGITTVKMQVNNLKNKQWLALGLSLDESMGDDHVFVCRRLSDDTVILDRRANPGGYTLPVMASTVSNSGGTFTATRQTFENGICYCEFTLSNFPGSKRRRRAVTSLSQTQTYHPLVAIGNLDSSNEITSKHTIRSALSKTVQLNRDETINYNADSSDSSNESLMKAHGIIMIFTWILFVSTGILIARHFKPVRPDDKICGKPIWFAVHRAVMTSVAVLVIVAFILILVYEKGKWVSQTSRVVFAHSIVGIITICFAIIQPIMALFRCKPEAPNRYIFNYAHRFVGYSALLLSIVAIFLAMFFEDFQFNIKKEWAILIGWSCWIPIIFFIFWFIEFYFRRHASDADNPNSYDLDDGNGDVGTKNPPNQSPHNHQQNLIKTAFLGIHFIVALGIALALAILVGKT